MLKALRSIGAGHAGVLFLILALLSVFVVFFMQTPLANKNWVENQALTATTETAPDGTVTIKNVRDWTYSTTSPTSKDWRTVVLHPEDIQSVWFLIEPFSALKAIGHTFLSFQFKDGSAVSFSVEARREVGESYSAWRGLLPSYELSYQWGVERDFVTRRLIYLQHPLRLYKLSLTGVQARSLFNNLLIETDLLANQPRFYNTLTANCTNMLANIVNEHYPHTLPYDISWNLTGLSDVYLMREHFIAEKNGSTTETILQADLTPHLEEVETFSMATSSIFSSRLRSLVGQ